MVSIRGSVIVVVLFTVALVLGGGCKKDEKKDAPATPGQVTAEKAGGSTGQAAPTSGIADDLALLPVDSEIVMGLNFAQLQQSELWKKFVEPQMMKGDFQQKLTQFKDKCGFDPMTAVKSISLGMKGVGGNKPDGVVVVHGIDKAKTLACVDKMKEEVAKDGGEVTRDGDIVTIKSKDGEPVAMTFVNDSTALAIIGPNATSAGVKAAAAGSSALKTSPAFVDMYGKIKTNESLWMLMNGNSKAFDKAAAMGIKPKAVFGSINVTDGLTMDMSMRLESGDQATQMANAFKGQAQAVASMVDKLDITAEGSDVKMALVLSNEKLQQLIKNFGGMLGGLGAMGGQ